MIEPLFAVPVQSLAVREAGWEIRVHGWRKHKGRWELARNEDVS